MRKILFASIALLLFSMQAKAQKYFDVYQDGKVTTSIASTNVDSIGLTGDTFQDRKVNFYRNGKAVNSYLVSTVDSIKVFRIDEEQLVYLGVVGFNQELYEKPIDVLATSTSNFYTTYVDNLARKDGTLLYYAVDHALDMLKIASLPTPLTSVNLVTFTDGLDQGSLMLNSNYSTEEQYLNAVSSRIASTKVKGLPVTAYSLGLRGSDVTDHDLFQKNLDKLASSSEKAFEVSNMEAVRTRLQEICDQIISISNRQTFSLKIPGRSNGTLIRFTFDGNAADNSTLYIEGTFNLANRSLTNVTYHGIKATSGSFVQGTQDGIFVNFTFTGLQREDGNGLIPKENVREYYKTSGALAWQQNSEFKSNNNTQTTITHSGAVIILVLDCSSSLGSQFREMKYNAQNFINSVAANTSEFKVEAPTTVTASLANDFTITVNWSVVKHAKSYDVYRSIYSSGSFTKVATGVEKTSWTDSNPLPGNNYYRVCSVGHGLTSQPSSTSNVINYALDAPSNVTASATNDYTVKLKWNAVEHADYYVVYRSNAEDGTYNQVSSEVTSTSWTDTEPFDGFNYYYVAAYGHGLEAYDKKNVLLVYLTTQFVDLGLPSGTLWATCNIGANSPEEYGDYFAWGETEGYHDGKTVFLWSTYKWCNGSYDNLTKYCNDSSYGNFQWDKNGRYYHFTDDKYMLDLEDDAAYVNLGPAWRMPSKQQFQELINSSYTTTAWTTLNGVYGRKITSKKNGNSIFLPAAGRRYDTSLSDVGSSGRYWSRNLYESDPRNAWSMIIYIKSCIMDTLATRSYGYSVRPVRSSE